MTMLPEDGHVHSEWSWDAPRGDMQATCARAVRIGLRSLCFSEHVDLTPWQLHGESVQEGFRARDVEGELIARPLDIVGYLEAIERCRERFPELRILSGLEFSEPHRHVRAMDDLLSAWHFDRVLGSVHCLEDLDSSGQTDYVEIRLAYRQRPPTDLVRRYLEEISTMVRGDQSFQVLAHIDYPLRYWPAGERPFQMSEVEDEWHEALSALAASGRALEINTRLPMAAEIVTWWHASGGDAVTFGSDAHEPDRVAHEFIDTAKMAEALGFRPGPTPYEMWRRA